MLTYLILENFRAFSKRVRIDIRPITVLIGKNSSGKSSVLKFLQMLRQSVNGTEGPFFKTQGQHVNLGAWKDLKNRTTRGKFFKYSLGFRARLTDLSNTLRLHQRARETGKDLPPDFAISDPQFLDYAMTGARMYHGDGKRGTFELAAREDGKLQYHQKFGSLAEIGFLNFPINTKDPDQGVRMVFANQMYLEPARNLFASVRHLGPTRSDSPRTIQAESPPDGEVGHRGEFALAHLVRMLESERKKKHIPFITRFCESVLRMDKVELREQIAGLYTSFEARNLDTQVRHWLADFGFGVSQCLPIFVQGALMSAGEVFTIEQPEAQLHPTAQLELGSYFATLWRERGVSSIIETHSGNILLRLRKLVRSGELSCDDVNVAYVHAESGVTEVTNLKIGADGELDGGGRLPMEFFGADVFEALEMNAITPKQQVSVSHEG